MNILDVSFTHSFSCGKKDFTGRSGLNTRLGFAVKRGGSATLLAVKFNSNVDAKADPNTWLRYEIQINIVFDNGGRKPELQETFDLLAPQLPTIDRVFEQHVKQNKIIIGKNQITYKREEILHDLARAIEREYPS
jgi:hypothetical protein